MRTNKIAKNLLQDKTCNTCNELKHCTSDGKEYCGPVPLSEALSRLTADKCEHHPLPDERTCEDWKLRDPSILAEMILPIVRRTYPNMVAKDIVSTQLIEMDTDIYRLKNDDD